MAIRPLTVSLRGAKRRGNPSPNRVIARSEATWQSLGSIVRLKCSENRCHEIATASSKPRNDSMIGGTYPITKNSILSDGVLCVGVTYLPV